MGMDYHIQDMNFTMGELFRRIFGDILTDLGNLEGDYRVANLRADISQSILYMFIIGVSILLMLRVDSILYTDSSHLFLLMVLYRGVYLLITLMTGIILSRMTRVRNYDRLSFDAAAACGQAVTADMLNVPCEDLLGPSPKPEGTTWQINVNRVKGIWGL